jgi:hypothetical protein
MSGSKLKLKKVLYLDSELKASQRGSSDGKLVRRRFSCARISTSSSGLTVSGDGYGMLGAVKVPKIVNGPRTLKGDLLYYELICGCC